MTTIAALCEKHKIDLEFTGPNYGRDESGWEHNAYRVTLRRNGMRRGSRRFTTDYKMGIGLTEDPSAARVLESLLMDAQAGAQTFEDFCSDFGYDTDSRKALATHEACVRTAKSLHRFLGDAFEDFQQAEPS